MNPEDNFNAACSAIELAAKKMRDSSSSFDDERLMISGGLEIFKDSPVFLIKKRIEDSQGLSIEQSKDLHMPFPSMIMSNELAVTGMLELGPESFPKDAKGELDFEDPVGRPRVFQIFIPAGDLSGAWSLFSGLFTGLEIREHGIGFKRERSGWMGASYMVFRDGELQFFPFIKQESITQELWEPILGSVYEIMSLAYILNQPEYFVVSETPAKIRKVKGNVPKIPRSDERQKYTYLTIGEVREIIKAPANAAAAGTEGRRITERMGHYRTLRSERYTNKRWQRIWIEPIWHGPEEVKVGNKMYKVHLNIHK